MTQYYSFQGQRLTARGVALAILIGVVIVAVITLAISLVFMLLWNWIVPSLFDGPVISIWLAWGDFIPARDDWTKIV